MSHTQYRNFSESPANENNPDRERKQRETAQYIADLLLELRLIAKANGLLNLQSIMEISYYEAFNAAHRVPVPQGEAEHLLTLGADARKSLAT
jgi:hypothetical protein